MFSLTRPIHLNYMCMIMRKKCISFNCPILGPSCFICSNICSTFIIALQSIDRDTSYVKRFLNRYKRIW